MGSRLSHPGNYLNPFYPKVGDLSIFGQAPGIDALTNNFDIELF